MRTWLNVLAAVVSFVAIPSRAHAFSDGEIDSPYSSIGLDVNHAAMAGQGAEEIDLHGGIDNLDNKINAKE